MARIVLSHLQNPSTAPRALYLAFGNDKKDVCTLSIWHKDGSDVWAVKSIQAPSQDPVFFTMEKTTLAITFIQSAVRATVSTDRTYLAAYALLRHISAPNTIAKKVTLTSNVNHAKWYDDPDIVSALEMVKHAFSPSVRNMPDRDN